MNTKCVNPIAKRFDFKGICANLKYELNVKTINRNGNNFRSPVLYGLKNDTLTDLHHRINNKLNLNDDIEVNAGHAFVDPGKLFVLLIAKVMLVY